MIRIYIKDWSLKENAYKIGVLHHSGMVVDFSVAMNAPMKEIVEKFNQAIAFSEVNMAMAFYSGEEVKDGQKLVTEENTGVFEGNKEVPQVEAGNSGVQSTDGVGDKS